MNRDRFNPEESLADMAAVEVADEAYDVAADFESLCDSLGEVAPQTPVEVAYEAYRRDRLAA